MDVQVDTNRDRLVSLNEFIAATKKDKFLEKDEWEVGLPSQNDDVTSVVNDQLQIKHEFVPDAQTLEQNPVYTEEELQQFEQQLAAEHSDLNRKSEELHRQREELWRKEEELNAQRLQLQQVSSRNVQPGAGISAMFA